MNATDVTKERVLAALREVIDPEMGMDIVSLGLIYTVQIQRARVFIGMTLTMRGCPLHDSIVGAVRLVLLNLDGVEDVEVELVWDPPWTPALMVSDAQERLN
jgi:metal-sulfur cluster biosynthetic enzyme